MLRRDNPDVPVQLQGATVLYTTKTDVKVGNKFVLIDDNKELVKNRDGKAVRFGFDEYTRFVDNGYIDLNENADRIIQQDIGMWKMQQAELIAKRDEEGENIQHYDLTAQKELVKDPSAHLLSFFVTCFIITLVVCLGRVFAPMIMEGVQGILN